LAKMAKQKGVKLEQNITIGLFILAVTVVGAPIVFYRRFQLLQNHLTNLELKLGTYKTKETSTNKEKDKKNDELIRSRSIKPGQFAGFAFATFIILAVSIISFTLPIYYLVVEPTWGSDALMILFPLGMGSLSTTVAFAVRTVKEEKQWVKAFNNLACEASQIN
ncbi:MAG: hypothetical protein ACTSSH_09385, partial [Candidatus Heimdallarchaeota archaeon]